MQRINIRKYGASKKCLLLSKWKQFLPRWTLFLFVIIPFIATLIFHFSNNVNINIDRPSSYHNNQESLLNSRTTTIRVNEISRLDSDSDGIANTKMSNRRKQLNPHVNNATTTIAIAKKNKMDHKIGDAIAIEDTNNEESIKDISEVNEPKENTKTDFVLNAGHNFKKNIKTQGRTATKGYFKPFDLEKYNQPTLEEVQGLYGDKIVIHGLDQCNAYRDKVPGKSRYVAPAGLQNTGTNTLYKLLQRNCYMPERWAESNSDTPFNSGMDYSFDCQTKECKKLLESFDMDTGMREMVPWWKHAMPSWRETPPYILSGIGQSKEGQRYDRMNALPIVMIKDPVHWMSSMCRNQYEVRFYRPMGRCPKLAPLNKPLPKLNKSRYAGRTPKQRPVIITPPKGLVNKFFIKYDSLADMWVDYYNEWTNNALFPNLIVRYEDLLFHPKEVINQVCTCAGGKMRDDFRLMEKSSKAHGNGILGPNTSRTGLSAAIIMYGTKEIRDSVLDQADKKFAGEKLNSNVMDTFHYQPP